MRITLNGEERDVPEGTTIRQLVEQSKLTVDKVAVEKNRRLVREAAYDQPLAEQDQVEIVTFVGGG